MGTMRQEAFKRLDVRPTVKARWRFFKENNSVAWACSFNQIEGNPQQSLGDRSSLTFTGVHQENSAT